MPTANEELRDLLIGRQVAIQRLSVRHQRELLRILEKALKLANRELQRRLYFIAITGTDSGPYMTQHWRNIERTLGALLRQTYIQMGEEAGQMLLDLTAAEARFLATAIGAATPGVALGLSIPSAALLETIARREAIQGGPLGAYFAKKGKKSLWKNTLLKYRKEIEDAVATGLLTAESVDATTRRVGVAVRRLARWQLRSVIDTATKQVASASRLAFLQANAGEDGVVKGYQWLSTLDLHTTKEYCIPRDGKAYGLDFEPIGHGYAWGAGPGAIHWGCRSGSTAILKSWRELGLDYDELTGVQRASMDGQIASTTTARKWYANRKWTEGELRSVFGKRKAQRILDGDLTVAGALRGYGVRVA